ncbi:AAA family ATPase [Elioraea sp.]|uniref:AAA family ATPase n=1 Tax=Elioraea sp. TaxID=2185103 RepID=UPI003F71D9BE
MLDVEKKTTEDVGHEDTSRPVVLSRPLVVAYTADAEAEGALRSAMGDLGDKLTLVRGNVAVAIRELARSPTPQVLIVDVSDATDPLVALDDLASVCEPDVKVLVMGERTDMGFYREITRGLGVVEYLYKPLTRDNVARLFLPVVHGRMPGGAEQVGGRIITVSGTHGGVGTTTVAVNLAVQLAESTRGYVALLDLHLQTGAATTMLGVKPGAGLRVALEEPDRVDALFLERTAVAVSDRLRLLAAEEAFEATPKPTAEGVARLMTLLRRRFNYIVVDMPTPADAALLSIFSMAQMRLLVMTPDVVSIRDATRLKTMLTAVTGSDKALMVLNRAGMQGAVATKLVERGLETKVDFAIPEIPKHLAMAADLGVPAATRNRTFAAAMQRLTKEVSGVRVGGRSGGWLSRLLGR